MRIWLSAASIVALPAIASAAAVSGRVADASTREPLERMRVEVPGTTCKTTTGPGGVFRCDDAGAGDQELRVAGVGYRPVKIRFTIAAGESKEFEIAINPETLRQSESVQVTAGVYHQETAQSIGLSGNELKNLASVLADDPLRAVQGLPGVASNDDFQSQFSVRGAGMRRIGIYFDDILLHQPFHESAGDPNGASLTIFNGDMLDSVNLHAGAPPMRFADRSAGILELRTREGDRKRLSLRGTVSASNAGALVEGPIGRRERGSWLVTARKSYLQYIISRTSDEPGLAFAFSDVQGRANYDLTSKWNLSLSAMRGNSGLDRSGAESRLGLHSFFKTDYVFTVANMALRYTRPSLMAVTRAAFVREVFTDINRTLAPLAGGTYGEWVGSSTVTWIQRPEASLDFGGTVRRLRDEGYLNRAVAGPPGLVPVNRFAGTASRSGIYAQESWALAAGKIRLSAGGRADHHDFSGATVWSPYASVGVQPVQATRVTLSWGHYAQFPDTNQFFMASGGRRLAPERAIHYEATLEQRIDDRTRIRAQVFDRQDRDLLFQAALEPRVLANGRIYTGALNPPWFNSQRGYARGFTVLGQRRTANGFTGWLGYTWTRTRLQDRLLGIAFPSDFDQRHAVNFFGSYRLRPTVNLSTKVIYGSGYPVRGFFMGSTSDARLSRERNALRIPSYQRTDFRINKAFVRDRWHITLFAEAISLTNHGNVRFDDINGFNGATGAVRLGFEKTFPILPSAGIVVEF